MIGEALNSLQNFLGTERCYLADMKNKKNMVIFDSVQSENWSMSATITKYTVEKGNDISDNHVKAGAESVRLQVTITNHTGISILNPVSLSRIGEDRVTKNLDLLKEWLESGVKLTYSGSMKEPADNFYITSFSPGKNSGTGDGVDISLTLTKGEAADELEGESGDLSSLAKVVKKGLANTAVVVAALSLTNYNILMGK